MQYKIMFNFKLLKLYQFPILIFLIPALIVLVRYHDVRGSFFPESYQFQKISGFIEGASEAYATKGVGFDVVYRYEVSGKFYTSNRIGFSWKSSRDKEKVNALLNTYSKGKEVDVFYALNNPSFSVLEPNRNSKIEFAVVFLLLYTFGLLVVYLTRKSTTKISSGRRKARR